MPDATAASHHDRQGSRVRSILFIRSIPAEPALRGLRWLRQNAPAAHITALTSASSRAAIEAAGIVNAIDIQQRPRFDTALAGLPQRLRLRRWGFDAVVVPCTGRRRAFANVARFALALGGRTTLWLDCDRLPEPGSLDAALDRVTAADAETPNGAGARIRQALFAAIKWPALLAAFAIAMALLAATAAILLPLVWLKPAPPDEEP